jgi:sugar lactone lactonase YvrE
MLRFRIALCVAVVFAALAAYGQQQNVSVVVSITGSGANLFVPDRNNNRVLMYERPYSSGSNAAIVLGQTSFNTSVSGTTDSSMSGPTAYGLDLAGNLYVSDTNNCRVTQFRPPFTDGKAASLVIGKADLTTSCSGAASASNVGNTGGVASDLLGNLWVVDSQNSRVLRFKRPLVSGMAADLVIGQGDFLAASCNRGASSPSAATLCTPTGIAFDLLGNLWVADSGNHRVLQYKTPLTTNMNASVELGHPALTAFTSSGMNDGGVSARSLAGPTGISVDLFNRLWVADSQNNRVLRFDSQFHNGGSASLVLGQSNFTESSANQGLPTPTAATLQTPNGVVPNLLGLGGIWVGDTSNNRTMLFSSPNTNGANASVVLGQLDFTHNLQNQGNVDPNAKTQSAPFAAGPSLIALGVLAGLVGLRHVKQRGKK